jgi:hypothetical protein
MEALSSSDTSVLIRATRRNIQEDVILDGRFVSGFRKSVNGSTSWDEIRAGRVIFICHSRSRRTAFDTSHGAMRLRCHRQHEHRQAQSAPVKPATR